MTLPQSANGSCIGIGASGYRLPTAIFTAVLPCDPVGGSRPSPTVYDGRQTKLPDKSELNCILLAFALAFHPIRQVKFKIRDRKSKKIFGTSKRGTKKAICAPCDCTFYRMKNYTQSCSIAGNLSQRQGIHREVKTKESRMVEVKGASNGQNAGSTNINRT